MPDRKLAFRANKYLKENSAALSSRMTAIRSAKSSLLAPSYLCLSTHLICHVLFFALPRLGCSARRLLDSRGRRSHRQAAGRQGRAAQRGGASEGRRGGRGPVARRRSRGSRRSRRASPLPPQTPAARCRRPRRRPPRRAAWHLGRSTATPLAIAAQQAAHRVVETWRSIEPARVEPARRQALRGAAVRRPREGGEPPRP